MARGKDERFNQKRVVSRFHVVHDGETASVHDNWSEAYAVAGQLQEHLGEDETVQVEARTEDFEE